MQQTASGPRRRTRRATVALLAMVMAAAGCGRSEVPAAQTSSTTGGTASPAASAPLSRGFGTLADVCGPGSPSGSPAQGVTSDEVRVGTFADPGTQFRPGLNQELFDVATVFSTWCNRRGGINGRKIVVDEHDAALVNAKARMIDACRDDFLLVGGGAVFDQDGVDARLQCLLPDLAAFVVSTKARGADLLVQPLPNRLDEQAVGSFRYLEKKYPDAVDHVGLLAGDINTTKTVAAQLRGVATDDLGWKLVFDDVYPAAGMSDWAPYAQKLKDAGVKGLIWVGEPEGLASLLGALRDIGYPLDFVRTDANHYDQNLVTTAGSALDTAPVYVHTGYEPFEEAKPSTPMGEYLEAFRDDLPNGKARTGLGVMAWSAWLMFAKAAGSCGDDLTRRCVYDAARDLKGWTGGGLHAPNDQAGCYVVEKATSRGFVRMKDTEPNVGIYRCGPREVVPLADDPSWYTKLSDVGQSLANLK